MSSRRKDKQEIIDLPNEIWKAIPSYEGLYEASTAGRIKSCDRIVPHSKDSSDSRVLNGKLLRYGYNTRGYQLVVLSKNGKTTTKHVHVLIAITFLDHIPKSGFIVEHDDEDKNNNSLSNIKIRTQRVNVVKHISLKKDFETIGTTKISDGRYKASIYVNGKTKNLGVFQTRKLAHNAYLQEFNKINQTNIYGK